jgi:hypothetical protein
MEATGFLETGLFYQIAPHHNADTLRTEYLTFSLLHTVNREEIFYRAHIHVPSSDARPVKRHLRSTGDYRAFGKSVCP